MHFLFLRMYQIVDLPTPNSVSLLIHKQRRSFVSGLTTVQSVLLLIFAFVILLYTFEESTFGKVGLLKGLNDEGGIF